MAETNKAKKAVTTKIEPNRPIIYLGPNMPQEGLKHGMVFSDYPTHLNELYGKVPAVKKLFFDVQETVKVKANLKKQGTELNRIYSEASREYADIRKKKGGNS